MKRIRFSEELIIGILKEHGAGFGAKELCRRHGVSDAMFYKWRSKCGGMEVSDARKLKALEAENAELRKRLAEQVMDVSTLKEMLAKKMRPGSRRNAGSWAMNKKKYTQRRACALAGIDPRVCRRTSRGPADTDLRDRLKALSSERRRFGYRRLHILLRREGWPLSQFWMRLISAEMRSLQNRPSRSWSGMIGKQKLPTGQTQSCW